ncbi:hypothetical protein PR048_008588 [Dryococelus australis]|uniref:Uncharacterized protein n=1 Tax=Dryococelus australis TaxID=614101 RepID=A0ABQ9HXJ7_9NEOP|nr:hypothetical protein PR048_008588 [Dryococelus australis]
MALRNQEDALIAAACCAKNKIGGRKGGFVFGQHRLEARKKYGRCDLLEDFQRDDQDLLAGELTTDRKYLLPVIGPRCIPTKEKLAVTLTGYSFANLAVLFKMSKSIINLIVPEVCDVLIDALQCYVRVSTSQHIDLQCSLEEWLIVAENFEKKLQFPNCVLVVWMGSMSSGYVGISEILLLFIGFVGDSVNTGENRIFIRRLERPSVIFYSQ